MTRKHLVATAGIAAIFWTVAYIIAIYWITDGAELSSGDRFLTLFLGSIFIGLISAGSALLTLWVVSE